MFYRQESSCTSFLYYGKGAELGCPLSQWRLGHMYKEGIGVNKKAVK